MPREMLRKTLDELHEELAQSSDLDAATRARLQRTIVEIQQTLARATPPSASAGVSHGASAAGSAAAAEPSTVGPSAVGPSAVEPSAAEQHTVALEDWIRDFEAAHPRLAYTIGRVIDLLARSGI